MVRVRRAGLAAGVLAAGAALVLSSCGRQVVTDAVPQAPPYDGPLFVEVTAPPSDEDADRSGAAGRAVDCDAAPVGYSEETAYGGGVDRDPVDALVRSVRSFTPGASGGLHVARTEADRILYTWETERRTRLAFVVHRGRGGDDKTGWYVESWARCDWAELPPSWAADRGLQLWEDRAGRPVATTTVVSHTASGEDCLPAGMTTLDLAGGSLERGRSYAAHPDPDFYPDFFTVAYAENQPLPASARATGYERDGRQLWLAADGSRAYVGTSSAVDVWPAEVQPLGCA